MRRRPTKLSQFSFHKSDEETGQRSPSPKSASLLANLQLLSPIPKVWSARDHLQNKYNDTSSSSDNSFQSEPQNNNYHKSIHSQFMNVDNGSSSENELLDSDEASLIFENNFEEVKENNQDRDGEEQCLKNFNMEVENMDEDYDNEESKEQDEQEEIQQLIKFSKTIKRTTIQEIEEKKVCLGPQQFSKTIIFDLDETLISSTTRFLQKQKQQQGNIETRCDQQSSQNFLGFNINIEYDDQYLLNIQAAYRPYLIQTLKYLSSKYELGIFTASDQRYSDAIVSQIDPNGEYFSFKLCRQHCIVRGDSLIKDLSIIKDRKLENLVIIDNSILAFAFQLQNGVPISPFNGSAGDKDDQELLFVVQYIEEAMKNDDVREYNNNFLMLEQLE